MNERFTARMYMDYVLSRKGIAIRDLNVAPVVVLSWSRGVVESMAESMGAELSKHWADFEGILYTKDRVSFAQVPVGAPATIAVMEELIACGADTFIGLGTAGSLQPEAPIGTCVIPDSCVREEGTSLHYPVADISSDPELAGALEQSCMREGLNVLKGALWTTDGVYRELVSSIEEYRGKGVLGVDMETSAMYALGRFRGVNVCNLLVVSDELWHEWKPAFGSAELMEKLKRAERAVLYCAKELSDSFTHSV
jgi:uridine phosphorylase